MKHYIEDSIDLQIIKGIILKPRHKLLMPILSMNLLKNLNEKGGSHDSHGFVKKGTNPISFNQLFFKNSFYNRGHLAEMMSIEDAVFNLKKKKASSAIEKELDMFFLEN